MDGSTETSVSGEPAAKNSIRSKLVEKLAAAIVGDAKEVNDEATSIATEIEVEIDKRFTDRKEYSGKGRSLVFNITKNANLRKRVFSRELDFAGLVTASAQDLATEALKLARHDSMERYYAQRSLGQSDELVVGWNAGTSGKLDWSHKYEKETANGEKPMAGGGEGGDEGGGEDDDAGDTGGGGAADDDDDEEEDEDYGVGLERDDDAAEAASGGSAPSLDKGGVSAEASAWLAGFGERKTSKPSLVSPRAAAAAAATAAAAGSPSGASVAAGTLWKKPSPLGTDGALSGGSARAVPSPRISPGGRTPGMKPPPPTDDLLADLLVGTDSVGGGADGGSDGQEGGIGGAGLKRARGHGGDAPTEAEPKRKAIASSGRAPGGDGDGLSNGVNRGEYGAALVRRCTLREAAADAALPGDDVAAKVQVAAALATVRRVAAKAKQAASA